VTEPIRFDGWWGEEDRAECPEPWERFTVMVHGEEAGDYREATVEDLALAGFVPLKEVEKVARWHFSGMLPSDERAELEVDVFMRRLRQQMGCNAGDAVGVEVPDDA